MMPAYRDRAEGGPDHPPVASQGEAAVDDDQQVERYKCAFDPSRIGDKNCCEHQVCRGLEIELEKLVAGPTSTASEMPESHQREDVEKRQEWERAEAFLQDAQAVGKVQPEQQHDRADNDQLQQIPAEFPGFYREIDFVDMIPYREFPEPLRIDRFEAPGLESLQTSRRTAPGSA